MAHNYHVLRQKLDPKTLLLAVVKAYSYGHETAAVARKLVALGINYFAVAYASRLISKWVSSKVIGQRYFEAS